MRRKVKTIKGCSVEHILDLVNAVLPEQAQIKAVGSRLYEITTPEGTKMRGSLTCMLFLVLLAKFLKDDRIDWSKMDLTKWAKIEWPE